jgi:hypothetical protein
MAVPNPSSPAERPAAVRRHARRVAITVAGGSTVALGVVLLPLPGPGTLVILAGLSILGREYPRAHHAANKGKGMASAAVKTAQRGAGRLGNRFRGEGPSE